MGSEFAAVLERNRDSFNARFAHARRTNRGLYSGLCGELPNLQVGVPKMTAYLDGGTRECLPKVLRRNGYRTVYLQAAPLAFMLKDQFMRKAGFEELIGDAWFERHGAAAPPCRRGREH